jgi:hypothetical protein
VCSARVPGRPLQTILLGSKSGQKLMAWGASSKLEELRQASRVTPALMCPENGRSLASSVVAF